MLIAHEPSLHIWFPSVADSRSPKEKMFQKKNAFFFSDRTINFLSLWIVLRNNRAHNFFDLDLSNVSLAAPNWRPSKINEEKKMDSCCMSKPT